MPAVGQDDSGTTPTSLDETTTRRWWLPMSKMSVAERATRTVVTLRMQEGDEFGYEFTSHPQSDRTTRFFRCASEGPLLRRARTPRRVLETYSIRHLTGSAGRARAAMDLWRSLGLLDRPISRSERSGGLLALVISVVTSRGLATCRPNELFGSARIGESRALESDLAPPRATGKEIAYPFQGLERSYTVVQSAGNRLRMGDGVRPHCGSLVGSIAVLTRLRLVRI
jgi:hypothetical protein